MVHMLMKEIWCLLFISSPPNTRVNHRIEHIRQPIGHDDKSRQNQNDCNQNRKIPL